MAAEEKILSNEKEAQVEDAALQPPAAAAGRIPRSSRDGPVALEGKALLFGAPYHP